MRGREEGLDARAALLVLDHGVADKNEVDEYFEEAKCNCSPVLFTMSPHRVGIKAESILPLPELKMLDDEVDVSSATPS